MEVITRESMKSIIETAEAAGNFKSLVAAIESSGLHMETSEGPFTVLAPTDAAFSKLPAGTMEALLRDPGRLQIVLLSHMIKGELRSADIRNFKELKAASGRSLKVKREEHGLAINGARLLIGDVLASDGVIHVVDSVILP